MKLIAFAAALLVTAGSAQAAAVKVKPTASITAATKSSKYAKFQLGVAFPIPAGAAAADCSGKVTVSTKLSKKKTAKWTGKLAALGPDCVAKVKARLVAKNYGKKLKFTVAFKGNKKLKPFSKSWNLKIVPPPPTPSPLPVAPPPPPPFSTVGVHNTGWWDINSNDPDDDDFQFFIKPDYSVTEITSTSPPAPAYVKLQCTNSSPLASVTFDTGFSAKQDMITVQSTQTYGLDKAMVHTFHFDWKSPITGVGSYSSIGQYNVGTEDSPVYENCTGGFTFDLVPFTYVP